MMNIGAALSLLFLWLAPSEAFSTLGLQSSTNLFPKWETRSCNGRNARASCVGHHFSPSLSLSSSDSSSNDTTVATVATAATAADDNTGNTPSTTTTTRTTTTPSQATATAARPKSDRVAVLLCPAQFCVPADYQDLLSRIADLEREDGAPAIATCRVAPLPRTEWIKVARNLPSRAFLEARLPVHSTLSWYFDAMENALAEIYAQKGHDVNVCIIGHSIGGWVSRAYLGGLGRCSSATYRLTQERCSSFITIGTPHSSPEGALVDQTRGLLREIALAPQCSSQALVDRGIDVTCVGSSSLKGKFLSTNIEEIVAASSYLPILGRLGEGDGIVPTDIAFMEPPARSIQLNECSVTGAPVRHAHVVPTPWNLLDGYAPSISLPEEFAWYGSDGVLPLWCKYIQ